MANNDITVHDNASPPLSFFPETTDLGSSVRRPMFGSADGALVTFGSKTDATWDGSSAASAISLFRWVGTKIEAVRALIASHIGTIASAAPTGAALIAGTDGTNLRAVTAAVFHNTDNQTIAGTGYGFLTGGVDQMINSSGNLDRKRSVAGDAMAATGLAAEVPMLWNGASYDRCKGVLGVAQVGAGLSSSLNITTAAVVKASAGRLVRVNVIVAGSAAGTVNDVATTGAAAAANEVAVIPNTVGTYFLDWPCATGIVVVPGTGQTVAVSYV